MSRIGKTPVAIPENVDVTVDGDTVRVKGPKGELSRSLPTKTIDVAVEDGNVVTKPKKQTIAAEALWGTTSSHIRNMVEGVVEPFEKKLVVEGVGFRAAVEGTTLVLTVGFSHQVRLDIPETLTVTVEKNEITVSGIDKEKVGQFAANVRAARKPEPYKGKGIHYSDEHVRRKQGKKSV